MSAVSSSASWEHRWSVSRNFPGDASIFICTIAVSGPMVRSPWPGVGRRLSRPCPRSGRRRIGRPWRPSPWWTPVSTSAMCWRWSPTAWHGAHRGPRRRGVGFCARRNVSRHFGAEEWLLLPRSVAGRTLVWVMWRPMALNVALGPGQSATPSAELEVEQPEGPFDLDAIPVRRPIGV